MYELTALFCRYLFIFYIFYFLFHSVCYILIERGTLKGSLVLALSKQRLAVIFMHLTAFLLLSYRQGSLLFDIQSLVIGAGGLVFLLFAFVATDKLQGKSCPALWNCVFFLADTGLFMLLRLNKDSAMRQLIWIFMGYGCALALPCILKLAPKLEKLDKLYIGLSYGLILLPFLIGIENGGSVNWISLGPITMQPSEIVKITYVLFLAAVFRKKPSIKEVCISGALCGGIVLALTLQRDLGGALIFCIAFILLAYLATGKEYIFLAGFGGAALASVTAYARFSHVKVRVAAWQNPWADVSGSGYQIAQSLFAIGTWGAFGSGLGLGYPNKVPVVENDFIFAAICEELGSLFGAGLIILVAVALYRAFYIGAKAKSRFYALAACGLACVFGIQSFLILGGVIKMIPLTGVTLPFVCYGGSSMVTSFVTIGLIQWIYGQSKGKARHE